MITEDFCSPEVTELLEEKGFTKDCIRIHAVCNGFTVDSIVTPDAPTHQSAMKWLREVHKIVIQIGIKITGASYYYQIWDYSTIHPNKFIGGMIDLKECAEDFNSYEDAVEAALKYALENIITKEGKQ